jgi:ParB family chromosome partitioning protein
MTHKRGLGRGLESLIPSGVDEAQPGVRDVALDEIVPNPWQPRSAIPLQELQELAASIREHGLIQPLVVTASEDGYELIAGERRWRAARLAGLARVPVIVKEASDRGKLELALVENLQRADLNPLEAAAAYQQLVDDFGLTHAEVAARVGKSRVVVSKALRLLRLPDVVKDALVAGEISEGHAHALTALEGTQDYTLALRQIRAQALTVRETEELVRRVNGTATAPEPAQPAPERNPHDVALENEFREALGTKVSLTRRKRGGRLVIDFYSDEELQAIYDAIVNG